MKSCIMAAWLLTVSVGNLLVVILAGVKLTEDMVGCKPSCFYIYIYIYDFLPTCFVFVSVCIRVAVYVYVRVCVSVCRSV